MPPIPPRFGDEARVTGPLALLPAQVVGELPLVMRSMEAQRGRVSIVGLEDAAD
jgi:hypothetical protein